jgi:hypothetical protein
LSAIPEPRLQDPNRAEARHKPDPLVKGKALRTLRDAGEYIAALPKKETALPHWQLAAQCLLAAVEKGGGLAQAEPAQPQILACFFHRS